jgi:hypothetical protein
MINRILRVFRKILFTVLQVCLIFSMVMITISTLVLTIVLIKPYSLTVLFLFLTIWMFWIISRQIPKLFIHPLSRLTFRWSTAHLIFFSILFYYFSTNSSAQYLEYWSLEDAGALSAIGLGLWPVVNLFLGLGNILVWIIDGLWEILRKLCLVFTGFFGILTLILYLIGKLKTSANQVDFQIDK